MRCTEPAVSIGSSLDPSALPPPVPSLSDPWWDSERPDTGVVVEADSSFDTGLPPTERGGGEMPRLSPHLDDRTFTFYFGISALFSSGALTHVPPSSSHPLCPLQ